MSNLKTGYKIQNFGKKATRRNYAKLIYQHELPDLIAIQTDSYKKFIETDLELLLKEISPIEGNNGDIKLIFEKIEIDKPVVSIAKAKEKDITYTEQIKVDVKLVDNRTGQSKVSQVVLIDMPKMTPTGTFIINGAERVIVSQIVRSAGIYYTGALDKKLNKMAYSGQMIPTRGAWVQFEIKRAKSEKDKKDNKDVIYTLIDKSKRINLSKLIAALGFNSRNEISDLFQNKILEETLDKDAQLFEKEYPFGEAAMELYKKLRREESAPGIEDSRDHLRKKLFDKKRYDLAKVGRFKYNNKLDVLNMVENLELAQAISLPNQIIEKGTILTPEIIQLIRENRQVLRKEVISKDLSLENLLNEEVLVYQDEINPNILRFKDVIYSKEDGEIFVEKDEEVTLEKVTLLRRNKSKLEGKVIKFFLEGDIYEKVNRQPVFVDIINVFVNSQETGKKEVVRIIGNNQDEQRETVTCSDILASISYYLNLYHGLGQIDDIDHLGNRRVRLIGELLQNYFRIGLAKSEKNIKDKISTSSSFEDMNIISIMNLKSLSSSINQFFGSSQLSQFMDQTNPLSELTQKRRISALGAGGISRDRAGIEVRDVHPSHYGRICPIETPEGQSIGLISSLTSYAEINEYGFIQTPYLVCDTTQKDENGEINPRVTDKIEKLTADQEYDYVVASSSSELNEDGTFKHKTIVASYKGETGIFDRSLVRYMNLSPKQIVSVAASTIPFLEHNEASRCLMGANMQRQAVPVVRPVSPIVGTGVELKAAKDSGAVVVSMHDGYVVFSDANKIEVLPRPEDKITFGNEVLYEAGKEWTFEQALKIYSYGLANTYTYQLITFERSNQDTCLLQRPIVFRGEYIEKGDIIADGPSTDKGELALGQNVFVAFMTWDGYNYEDAVIMSEDMVKNDVYTSIHIEEYSVEARKIKENKVDEQFTSEIPHAKNELKRKLDKNGIILIGTEVNEEDILVGKITPKTSNEVKPEEALTLAIIGEKAKDFKDSSLKVPHGGGGIVQKIIKFSKANKEDKDALPDGVNELVKVFVAKKRKIREGDKIAGRHGNKGVISKILPREDMPYMQDGTPIDIMLSPLGVPKRMNIGQILEIHLGHAAKKLGVKVATPVFEGVNDQDLLDIMNEANIDTDGKAVLYDGRTGEEFKERISVGVMYMIKLSHMVDDKLHTRNVGKYTLITQQPMGGKAQNGGQRFGEMEVWALYAYGAAYTLQEMLTVKSDDVLGRNETYKSILYGKPFPQSNLPESFRVLTREFQALGLYVELINDKTGENEAIKSIVDIKNEQRKKKQPSKEVVFND